MSWWSLCPALDPPVAIGDKEDTQLQVEAYPLPPLIRMQGPDPVRLRLLQEAASGAEAALPVSGLQTSSQQDSRFPLLDLGPFSHQLLSLVQPGP